MFHWLLLVQIFTINGTNNCFLNGEYSTSVLNVDKLVVLGLAV